MSSDQRLVSPVEIEEHGAGLPVHPAGLDGDPELGQLPGNPGEQARRELARTGETIRKRADETRADLMAPLGFRGWGPNFYAYVSNSPANFTDPSGRCGPFCVVGLVFDGYDVYKLITGFMIVRP
jgi:hypothetical protein